VAFEFDSLSLSLNERNDTGRMDKLISTSAGA
jgi:hypothetical protein